MPEGPSTTPWPLPPPARDVVLVGGTFDPPHRGHVSLAAAARDLAAPGAWLLFVPAVRSPHKSAGASPPHHRVAMLRLAIADVARAAVWTDEVDRAGEAGAPSFTVDTLERLHQAAPGVSLRLLLGADQAVRFHTWKSPERILGLARPLVLPRGPVRDGVAFRAAMAETGAWSDREAAWWAEQLVAGLGEPDPAASTDIRRIVRERGAGGVPGGWLAPGVAAYIERHGLYRGPGAGE